MTSFEVDCSRPLVSLLEQEQKLVLWTEDYFFVFCISSKRNVDIMDEDGNGVGTVSTTYWRCKDKQCNARAKYASTEHGEDFLVFSRHNRQEENNGVPFVDTSCACHGLLSKSDLHWDICMAPNY